MKHVIIQWISNGLCSSPIIFSPKPHFRAITSNQRHARIGLWRLPSGKLTVCYWKWPFIVDLPIKKMLFSIATLVYQRVWLKITITSPTAWGSGSLDRGDGHAPWCWYIYLQNWLTYGAPWSIWVRYLHIFAYGLSWFKASGRLGPPCLSNAHFGNVSQYARVCICKWGIAT